MADRMTVVEVPIPGCGGTAVRGWVDYETAVADARRYYEETASEAALALAALDAGTVTVWHQRGVHIARDRRRVEP